MQANSKGRKVKGINKQLEMQKKQPGLIARETEIHIKNLPNVEDKRLGSGQSIPATDCMHGSKDIKVHFTLTCEGLQRIHIGIVSFPI